MREDQGTHRGPRGVNVIAIATKDTIFPTIKIPENPAFCQFYQLMAGWNLLVHGYCAGANLDKPAARARSATSSKTDDARSYQELTPGRDRKRGRDSLDDFVRRPDKN